MALMPCRLCCKGLSVLVDPLLMTRMCHRTLERSFCDRRHIDLQSFRTIQDIGIQRKGSLAFRRADTAYVCVLLEPPLCGMTCRAYGLKNTLPAFSSPSSLRLTWFSASFQHFAGHFQQRIRFVRADQCDAN